MPTMGTIISLLDPFDALAAPPSPPAPLNFRSRPSSASLSTISKVDQSSRSLDQHQLRQRQQQQQVIYLEQTDGKGIAPTGRQQASRRALAHAQQREQQAAPQSCESAAGGERQGAATALAQRRLEQREQRREQQKNKSDKEQAVTKAKDRKTKTNCKVRQAASRKVDSSQRESIGDTCQQSSPAAPIKNFSRELEQAAELVEHFKVSSLIKKGEQTTQYSRVSNAQSTNNNNNNNKRIKETMTVSGNKHRGLRPVASSPPSTNTTIYYHNQQVPSNNQKHYSNQHHHHHRRSFQGSCSIFSQAPNHHHHHHHHHQNQQRQQQCSQQRSLSTCSSLTSSAGSTNGSTTNMLQQITTYHKSHQYHKNNKSTAVRHYQHQHQHHSSASSTVSSSDDSSGLPESGPSTPDHEDLSRPPPLPTRQMMQMLCSKAAAELMTFTTTGDIELPAAHLGWWQWCRSLGNQPANDHPSVHPEPPPRRWLYRNQVHSRRQQHNEFTVLSYNVLANRLVNSKVFPSSPQMALNWFYRRELILRQLVEFDADIVALQEVEQQHFDSFFRPHMESRGYGCLFGPKSRFKTMEAHKRPSVDGCAIFYKLRKFSLVQQHLLEYNQIAMANAKGSEAMLNRVMTKDNIGLAAILQMNSIKSDNSLPRQLLVCNTHIHWDPEYCDVKLIQTIMLMNELECIAKHHTRSQTTSPTTTTNQHQLFGGDQMVYAPQTGTPTNDILPLVLLGDFNSMPNSGVTTYLTEGKIDSLHKDFKNEKYTSCSNTLAIRTAQLLEQQQADGLTTRRQSSPAWCFYNQQPPSPTTSTTSSSSSSSFRSSLSMNDADKKILNYQHEFNLASAYDEHLMPYTNYTCNFKAMIDYIFYSQRSLELVGLLGPFDKDWFRKSGIQGLPQAHLPSDHLPLLAKLSLANNSHLRSSSHQINHQNQSY